MNWKVAAFYRFVSLDNLPLLRADIKRLCLAQGLCGTILLALIGAWGQTGPNPADLNGDRVVNVSDLLTLIGSWGPCV